MRSLAIAGITDRVADCQEIGPNRPESSISFVVIKQSNGHASEVGMAG
jgi:hypothetical protein